VRFRFADCTLDVDARTLTRRGGDVHLSPKAFELLRLLVENRPRALSKAELLEQVWPGVFVSDASLSKTVSRLRAAIGDDDVSSLIRTVHGYGYAFGGEVEEQGSPDDAVRESAAICWWFCGDREIPLHEGEHIVGREPDADVHLDSPRVSRRHAKVVVQGTCATLEDLGSKNGTFVGGVRISRATPLQPGDEARIGPFSLTFRVSTGPGWSTQTLVR
jgi:DNA-binding winged helix-turn-helix (wHTH) protein